MSRPSRFDTKKRNADKGQEQEQEQEQEQQLDQDHEQARLQTQMGNQAIAGMLGKAGMDGGGLSVEKLKGDKDAEKGTPDFGGDDDGDIEDGPLTAVNLSRNWNPGIKKGKDKPAFLEFMPDDDLPPEDEAWLASVHASADLPRIPGSASPDALMQPSADVVVASLSGWTRGIGQFTGPQLDQRALSWLVRFPPPFLQDAAGRVLVSRTRTGAIGMWTLLDTPTLRHTNAAATCAFVDFLLELSGRERLVENARLDIGEIKDSLPIARDVLATLLPEAGGEITPRKLPDGARKHALHLLFSLLRLAPPTRLIPSLAEIPDPGLDPEDPLGLDAVMQEFTGAATDHQAPVFRAAMLAAEKLASGCADTRVQMAGVASATAWASLDWSSGAPNNELLRIMEGVDTDVNKCLQLLVEIARASKGRMVGPKGLRNGLTRAAKTLARVQVTGAGMMTQVIAGVLPPNPDVLPPIAPIDDPFQEAWETGQPGGALAWLERQPDSIERDAAMVLTRGSTGERPTALAAPLLAVAERAEQEQRPYLAAALRTCAGPCLLARGDTAAALRIADAHTHLGRRRRNGLVIAEAAILGMEAELSSGDVDAAAARRHEAARMLTQLPAEGALTLLARWQPPGED